ncbi:7-alpha-hydroxysteroid dehydrogenase [Nonomuraea coxensis DSM 45129]|uniref:7-alpha-hydroxysteroid dehydrogenase n=1 Tax=Nonomuraea coxensis DSM 45129 TaxID=1122611 RepID=A0ABX8U221_9ACTN|nr:SDR family NAD(P)-dependent oxidoreductase [Nonomuraea coxensis]QYC41704.1 7-alpha-hydroxysteroid dehydrogenase [Nonomuraea coxensis DSM 45129]
MTRAALSGRTAIVVGAGDGAGAAVAYALSRAGAGVVLAARPGPALTALAAGIVAVGGQAVAVPADVGSRASMRRLVEQTLGAFGRLDIAVNQLRARELSVAMTYQLAAMRRAGGGHVVNLATSAAARTAVAELTWTAAQEHACSGVRIDVMAGAPGGSAEQVADAVVRWCSGDSP